MISLRKMVLINSGFLGKAPMNPHSIVQHPKTHRFVGFGLKFKVENEIVGLFQNEGVGPDRF
jgi:hypothetical protein